MLILPSPNGIDRPYSSEITPQSVYENRRKFLQALAIGGVGASGLLSSESVHASATKMNPLSATLNPNYALMEKKTPFEEVTTYNNFYEFGLDKSEPAIKAQKLKLRPWTLVIDGEVNKPLTIDIESLYKLNALEERIYRMRCVEGWSMVIPWIGYSLSTLLKKVEPTSTARFVEFTTLADAKQMPGLDRAVLDWPYTEALRLDEAMHPLTLLTLGVYGQELPRQNGAPVRVMVPWKYGFKSPKSIVRIRLTRTQPKTAWNVSAPQEYGFYSNVNPDVDHPRWSQASERRIGEDGLFARKRKTLLFNGYSEVASLYSGLDLKKNF